MKSIEDAAHDGSLAMVLELEEGIEEIADEIDPFLESDAGGGEEEGWRRGKVGGELG